MTIDPASGEIRWRLHLSSSPGEVFALLSTDQGRAQFWAKSATEHSGVIDFRFPNGMQWQGRILECRDPETFSVDYFGDRVTFELRNDGYGGTDLLLIDHGQMSEDRYETHAGWVSVLMALKAAADHGIDLRNHDPERTWDQGYTDN
jgi:uncharacterized protein YndB with AHSA1/START domain